MHAAMEETGAMVAIGRDRGWSVGRVLSEVYHGEGNIFTRCSMGTGCIASPSLNGLFTTPTTSPSSMRKRMNSLPGAKDSSFLGGIVRDYEVIKKKKELIKHCTRQKKSGKGEEENLVICTWPRQPLVIR
jgi:hypothetical protein